MTGKERTDTTQPYTKQVKKNHKRNSIDSSFGKLLKWRENEHFRVLNLAEQCERQNKLQLNNEDSKSEGTGQTRIYKITVIK